jgi:hypothetical protein
MSLQVQRNEAFVKLSSVSQHFADLWFEIQEDNQGLATLSSRCARLLGEQRLAEIHAKHEVANNKNPLKQALTHMELGALCVQENKLNTRGMQ